MKSSISFLALEVHIYRIMIRVWKLHLDSDAFIEVGSDAGLTRKVPISGAGEGCETEFWISESLHLQSINSL